MEKGKGKSGFINMVNMLNEKPIMKALKMVGSLIILIVLFSFATPKFLTVDNILTITLQMSIYCLLAFGICYVLLVGGAELSAGSIVGISAMTFSVTLRAGVPFVLALIITIALGLFIGLVNGFMVTKMHLIPFIATLGMQYIARGFCQIIANGQTVSLRSAVTNDALYKALCFIGSGKIVGPIPLATVIVAAFFAIHFIILNKTAFGRKVYAVGSNAEAARLSGIKADKVITMAYLISGFMATMAGLLFCVRLTVAQPAGGTGYEFEGIAACVIGGVSMMGGEGTVVGALIGASTLAVMRNGMNLLTINTFWQNVVTGIIIVIAVYMDIRRRAKEATRL